MVLIWTITQVANAPPWNLRFRPHAQPSEAGSEDLVRWWMYLLLETERIWSWCSGREMEKMIQCGPSSVAAWSLCKMASTSVVAVVRHPPVFRCAEDAHANGSPCVPESARANRRLTAASRSFTAFRWRCRPERHPGNWATPQAVDASVRPAGSTFSSGPQPQMPYCRTSRLLGRWLVGPKSLGLAGCTRSVTFRANPWRRVFR